MRRAAICSLSTSQLTVRTRQSPPTRLLDTRSETGPLGFQGTKPAATSTVVIHPSVRPGTNSVALNVTATEADGAGFVTVFPCDADRPLASNINTTAGATVANLVVTRLAEDGSVCLFTQQRTHLVVDLEGTFAAKGWWTPSGGPSRVLETRASEGQQAYAGDRPIAGQTTELRMRVPNDTRAVVLNLTSVDAAADGFVTVWPCDIERPLASNLNVKQGETRPNLVVTSLSPSGDICLYTHTPMDLVADIEGAFLAGGGMAPVGPVRVSDGRALADGKLSAGATMFVQLSVAPGTTAAALNVAATEAEGDGFITIYACDQQRPLASNLNMTRGATVANLVVTRVPVDGRVCFYSQATTYLVVDLLGLVGGS